MMTPKLSMTLRVPKRLIAILLKRSLTYLCNHTVLLFANSVETVLSVFSTLSWNSVKMTDWTDALRNVAKPIQNCIV